MVIFIIIQAIPHLTNHNLVKAAFIYYLEPKCSIKNFPLIIFIDPVPPIEVTIKRFV